MNKKELIKQLQLELNDGEEKCILINDILEEYFLIGKKNKKKITDAFKEKLSVKNEEAENIYEVSMKIISTALKEKMKHPFGSQLH